jgi:hypothetical protein
MCLERHLPGIPDPGFSLPERRIGRHDHQNELLRDHFMKAAVFLACASSVDSP